MGRLGTCTEDNHWPRLGNWLPGAISALRVLLRHGKVVIHSLRVSPYMIGHDGDPAYLRSSEDVMAEVYGIRQMLDGAGLQAVQIHTSHGKPPADFYIDNLAVEFNGDWREVLQKVLPDFPMSRRMREFETGATRDTDEGKLDYEAFFSPLVLKRRAEYMHKHRIQADGSLRDGDNWQKGIPKDVLIKSAWRHFYDWWFKHREQGYMLGYKVDIVESICALMFNCEGYLHELLKEGSDG